MYTPMTEDEVYAELSCIETFLHTKPSAAARLYALGARTALHRALDPKVQIFVMPCEEKKEETDAPKPL